MRQFILGAIAAAALALAVFAVIHHLTPPSPSASTCPAQFAVVSPKPDSVSIQADIVTAPSASRNKRYKPQYVSVEGACFEQDTGNLNVYPDAVGSVNVTLNIPSSLRSSMTWPANPADAVKIGGHTDTSAPPDNAAWPTEPGWDPNGPTVNGAALTFKVPAEARGSARRYRIRYVDPNDNRLKDIEPMIKNR